MILATVADVFISSSSVSFPCFQIKARHFQTDTSDYLLSLCFFYFKLPIDLFLVLFML